jgi:hypothetical protein
MLIQAFTIALYAPQLRNWWSSRLLPPEKN